MNREECGNGIETRRKARKKERMETSEKTVRGKGGDRKGMGVWIQEKVEAQRNIRTKIEGRRK